MTECRREIVLDLEEEETLRIDLEVGETVTGSSICLIGKVCTRKAFNAFGFLKVMKRAMAPTKGFTVKEIDITLFSFHFNYADDLKAVRHREPWLFDRNVVMLKELGRGEQPFAVSFNHVTF
ncbi:hypothetical protein ACS0TY_034928 [Phlomoides rotata]